MTLRSLIRSSLDPRIWDTLRYSKASICDNVRADDLDALAEYYGTDKARVHGYTRWYADHFHRIRTKPLKILEIGIGGHDNPTHGGASLRMWKHYFPHSHIFGIDIHDKSMFEEHRITIRQGDQSDAAFLQDVASEMGTIDIIIDDGSHIVDHVRESFDFLFPRLASGGIYVIEDLLTSYWPEFGGSTDLHDPQTTMGWLKRRVDGLNYEEFIVPDEERRQLDASITSLHFYHNIVFIYKGDNTDGGHLHYRESAPAVAQCSRAAQS